MRYQTISVFGDAVPQNEAVVRNRSCTGNDLNEDDDRKPDAEGLMLVDTRSG